MPDNDLHSTAFPKLNDAQLASLGQCSFIKRKQYQAGGALFRAGERDPRFYVLISGTVEIVDESGDSPKTIVVHGPGEFAGELSQLTGRPALVSGYARGGCEAYEVSPDVLKQLVNHQPDPGDLILQAFIARRQLLREPGNFTGLRVAGSHSSQATFRVRDFLTRNGALHTWLDLDADLLVGELMRQFGLTEADTPVVACGKRVLLKNPSNRQLLAAAVIRSHASSHPWEDWAETWAHYLRMTDTLETALSCGLILRPKPGEPAIRERLGGGKSLTIDEMIVGWFPLMYVLNNLNRGTGLPDAYPFVPSTPAIEKLRFVHGVFVH